MVAAFATTAFYDMDGIYQSSSYSFFIDRTDVNDFHVKTIQFFGYTD